MSLLEDLDYRREVAERHRENAARHAQAFARFTSTGQGSVEYAERVDFDLTFIEEPIVAYGCFVDADELADLQNRSDVVLPNCTGFVTEWDKDERDFYVGCWVAARVHFPLEDFQEETEIILGETPFPTINTDMNQAVVKHFFTFQGVAMKDVPVERVD
jgi:hypothetical protein